MQIDRQKARTSFISLVVIGLLTTGAIWWWQSENPVESGSFSQTDRLSTAEEVVETALSSSTQIDEEMLEASHAEADSESAVESDSNTNGNATNGSLATIMVEDDLSWLNEKGLPGLDALITDLQTNNTFEITLE